MENIDNKTTDTDPLPAADLKHRRTIKTYVMRSGRMTAAQERSYNELAPAWCIPFENKKINFVIIGSYGYHSTSYLRTAYIRTEL